MSNWIFDGRQKDAAEFLQSLLLSFDTDILGRWKARTQLGEGSIREDEGVAPLAMLHID